MHNFLGDKALPSCQEERNIMDGHDNMQKPTGGMVNEVNQAIEKGAKRVTLDVDIWFLVFKQV
jgi:hypothetical protein